jgi:hypothetical protein
MQKILPFLILLHKVFDKKKHWLQDNIFTLPIKITKTRTKSKLVVRYVQNFAKAPKK